MDKGGVSHSAAPRDILEFQGVREVQVASNWFVGAARDVGSRSRQEDNYDIHGFVDPDTGVLESLLMIVADGMGGHSGGDVASMTAVSRFVEAFDPGRDLAGPEDVPERLRYAAVEANRSIARAIDENEALHGMGATLVAVLIAGDALWWISIGDSPLFLLRDTTLVRLNEDHSMKPIYAQLAAEGRLDPNDDSAQRGAHVLRSALSGGELTLVDLTRTSYPLAEGDQLIVATDGIDSLRPEQIVDVLNRHDPGDAQTAVEALITAVKQEDRPYQDNVSILLYSHMKTA
jgi:serine/threonine protein phosphatase PrpC